ncbi:MAG: DNA polymerase I [Candidatus Omnitrophota bacterium]
MNTDRKNIYLIDGHALCYRAYYAIRELTTSKGMPTNAIYGFINMLRKLFREYEPGMMTIVFDSPVPTARHKKYKDYKITRKPMPDALISQMPRIKEVVEAYGIRVCQMDGYEADDIIATLAEKACDCHLDVTIVTGDKDALQLVKKGIRVLSPNMGADKIYHAEEIKDKYGVGPDLIIDLMALMGDASDNIPGVKGIGRLTASKLVSEYGSLEAIYNNIDNLSSESVRKRLLEGKKMAELSRELIELDKKVPIKTDMSIFMLNEPDIEKLIKLYQEFEFEKLLKEIMPQKPSSEGTVIADGIGHLKHLKSEIKKHGIFSFSVRSDSKGEQLKSIAICVEKGKSYFFTMYEMKNKNKEVYEFLKNIFEDENVHKISFRAKENIAIFRKNEINLKGIEFDAVIAEYLIDPARAKYDLSGMTMRYLGYKIAEPGDGLKWDKSGQANMDLLSGEEEAKSVCGESDTIMRLYGVLLPMLKKKHLDLLFSDVEMPLIEVLSAMEKEGVNVDVDYLKKQSKAMGRQLDHVSKDIYTLAGEEFNINSPKQLQNILYEKLKLPAIKKTKTGISTDESVLNKLAGMHELPKKLLEYRELNKLKTAYYDSFVGLAKDAKIYARFNQTVTTTGRLSSSEPNLQNIPIKTKLGKEIRRAFIAGEDSAVLLSADYSQIELRILAHLSEDANLIDAFRKGEDVHRFTAALIFDRDLKDITYDMRSTAKTVNFGIIYGMSSFGLAQDMNISLAEAQKFIDAYFERYNGVKKFIDNTISQANDKGFVTTFLKRRRYIPGFTSSDKHVRGFSERAAVNTPVQGSAADLIKLAMIACYNAFKDTDVKMIIQVHDELVFKVPKKKLNETAKKIKNIMETVVDLKVPLKVDIETGDNWLDMKDYELK